MPDYATLYHLLFNAITDALEQMEQHNYGTAKDPVSYTHLTLPTNREV